MVNQGRHSSRATAGICVARYVDSEDSSGPNGCIERRFTCAAWYTQEWSVRPARDSVTERTEENSHVPGDQGWSDDNEAPSPALVIDLLESGSQARASLRVLLVGFTGQIRVVRWVAYSAVIKSNCS